MAAPAATPDPFYTMARLMGATALAVDELAVGVGLPAEEPGSGDVEPGASMDEMIEMLQRGESVRLPGRDPAHPAGFYLIVPQGQGGCPNVAVHYRSDPTSAYLQPCVTHAGFPCEDCGDSGDYWAFSRAVIGAILAGRQIVLMCTNTVASSDHSSGETEVPHHGQGSEVEEARDGRPEEPQAERGEAIRYDRPRFDRIELPDRPIPRADGIPATGSIEWRSDGSATGRLSAIRLNGIDGRIVAEMTFEEAWRRLLGFGPSW